MMKCIFRAQHGPELMTANSKRSQGQFVHSSTHRSFVTLYAFPCFHISFVIYAILRWYTLQFLLVYEANGSDHVFPVLTFRSASVMSSEQFDDATMSPVSSSVERAQSISCISVPPSSTHASQLSSAFNLHSDSFAVISPSECAKVFPSIHPVSIPIGRYQDVTP